MIEKKNPTYEKLDMVLVSPEWGAHYYMSREEHACLFINPS
jgi:hypothetical protein